jgi:hypothetical protein
MFAPPSKSRQDADYRKAPALLWVALRASARECSKRDLPPNCDNERDSGALLGRQEGTDGCAGMYDQYRSLL